MPTGQRAGTGRGGMRSKLRAAELAAYNGIETHIAGARQPGVITACVKGEPVGTRIRPARDRFPPDARWIAGVAISHGSIVINRPAEESIRSGASLFASGIKKVDGQFAGGDVIEVVTPAGRLVARGVSKVSATLMGLIRAMRTDEIAIVLTEILARFLRGEEPRPPAGDRRARCARRWSRPWTSSSSYGYELTRRLALEIINLFPAATVEAMLGRGAGTRGAASCASSLQPPVQRPELHRPEAPRRLLDRPAASRRLLAAVGEGGVLVRVRVPAPRADRPAAVFSVAVSPVLFQMYQECRQKRLRWVFRPCPCGSSRSHAPGAGRCRSGRRGARRRGASSPSG